MRPIESFDWTGAAPPLYARYMMAIEPPIEPAEPDGSHESNISVLHRVSRIVKYEMEHALELSVPVEATLKTGKNWYDVESFDPDAALA